MKPVILSVDDDPGVSRAVARDLRRHYGENYRIIRAESGPQALDALKELKLRGQPVAVYPVDVEIEAYDRSGLLRDITQVLSSSKSDVLALNTLSNKDENTATMTVTLEISSLDQLAKLLAQIRNLPNIINVRRKRS